MIRSAVFTLLLIIALTAAGGPALAADTTPAEGEDRDGYGCRPCKLELGVAWATMSPIGDATFDGTGYGFDLALMFDLRRGAAGVRFTSVYGLGDTRFPDHDASSDARSFTLAYQHFLSRSLATPYLAFEYALVNHRTTFDSGRVENWIDATGHSFGASLGYKLRRERGWGPWVQLMARWEPVADDDDFYYWQASLGLSHFF